MMKNAIFTLSMILGLLFGVTGFAQEAGQTVAGQGDGPVLKLDKVQHEYGDIEYGGDGSCIFIVTNNGNQPLIISKCQKSCGCTIPECPQVPIAPGASEEITIKYDTKRPGPFLKSVTIHSNAINGVAQVIKIKGTVGAKPVENTPKNAATPVLN